MPKSFLRPFAAGVITFLVALALSGALVWNLETAQHKVDRVQALAIVTDHALAISARLQQSPEQIDPALFEPLVTLGYDYALWRTDAATGVRELLARSATVDPLTVDYELETPAGRWTLGIAPQQGWRNLPTLALRVALALLLSALVGHAARNLVAGRRRLVTLQSTLDESDEQIRALNQRLQATLDALPDLLFEMDLQGVYLDYHSPRTDLLAAPAPNLIGHRVDEVLPPEAAASCLAALQEASEHGFSQGRQIVLDLPQGTRWFELSVARKTGGATPTFAVLSRDITDRKTVELKLERLGRLYAALSHGRQAILHCSQASELFAVFCEDAVVLGGMKMAWIGMLQSGSTEVVPVAAYGEGKDYLQDVAISIDAGAPRGQGPTGTAMRQDRPFWCQDFQNDPATAVWHARGRQFGWASSAALPLHQGEQVVGALTVYSGEPGAFEPDTQALMVEMALDISFALGRLASEAQRTQAEHALRDSEERYRTVFQTSPDLISITRLDDGHYMDVNAGFERVTGWHRDEVLGRLAPDLGIWVDLAQREQLLAALRDSGRCEDFSADLRAKDGRVFPVLISAVVMQLQGVDCVLSLTRDVTETRRAQARIDHLAHFDQLTGLPNRHQLQQRFDFALKLAQRGAHEMALMFLDLDHFKTINDSLGHSAGDQLLVEVAARIGAMVRGEDTLARTGGDEFILLLPATDEQAAARVAAKLLAAVSQPCHIGSHELTVSMSMGIAVYPNDGEDFETLSKNADAALYRVKQGSRNDFCFFASDMQQHTARVLKLANALRRAVERDEFSLHYQPQLSLVDGRVVGAEALLRWNAAGLGPVAPAEFIPVAEDSGQILAIGEWVLRSAIKQLSSWRVAGLVPLTMSLSVNLSAVQFRHPRLFELVSSILEEAGLPSDCLVLELTEAAAMDDPLTAIALVNRLRSLGVRIAIDDFGTGYSNLSYLKSFKANKLKIDQSFMRDIGVDPQDKAIVGAIIKLAASLGMQTIAEGVETAGQLGLLRLLGCDEVQGYYFSKPLPADAFEAYLRAQSGSV